MKLRLLLFILYQKLKKAATKNAAYQNFLGGMQVKIMIKTADENMEDCSSLTGVICQLLRVAYILMTRRLSGLIPTPLLRCYHRAVMSNLFWRRQKGN